MLAFTHSVTWKQFVQWDISICPPVFPRIHLYSEIYICHLFSRKPFVQWNVRMSLVFFQYHLPKYWSILKSFFRLIDTTCLERLSHLVFSKKLAHCNLDRAPWRFVMVPNEIHDHFLFMDTNQDGLLSFFEYYSVHRVFNYLGYSKYDKHNFM